MHVLHEEDFFFWNFLPSRIMRSALSMWVFRSAKFQAVQRYTLTFIHGTPLPQFGGGGGEGGSHNWGKGLKFVKSGKNLQKTDQSRIYISW